MKVVICTRDSTKVLKASLSVNTGSNVTSLWDIDYLCDCLYIETVYNKTLPEWTKKVFPDHMKPMQDLSFKLSTYTKEMKRLRGGPIIQSILDHFHNFIAKNHERKMLMYSGHDTTLSALLNSMGMFDPPIGKVDLFELSSHCYFTILNDRKKGPV